MDLGYSSIKCEHAPVVDDVVNGLLVTVALTSCSVFDTAFVHQMSA